MDPSTSRRLFRFTLPATALLVAAGLAYGIAAGASAGTVASIVLVAGAYIGTGVVAWIRRPTNRVGLLMVIVGVGLVGNAFSKPMWPLILPLGLASYTVFATVFGYLMLAYPSGRLTSTASRALVALTAILLGGSRLVQLLVTPQVAPGPGGVNPYHLIDNPGLAETMDVVPFLLDLVVIAAFVCFVVVRWLRATPPARRILTPVVVPTVILLLSLTASTVLAIVPADPSIGSTLSAVSLLVRTLVPIGFLIGILRTRMARSAIADLVVELGEAPTPERLRSALASSLGDPTLQVGQWSPADGAYLDATGAHVALPAAGEERGVTLLQRDGRPLAAILHDPVLLDDPGLVAAVSGALRLAVENERLQGEVEAQLAEVKASRARIVEAGDTERRRVERNLHDGAQQRLVALTLALRLARAKAGEEIDPDLAASLEAASAEARGALAELRELARGIHPQILTSAGLGPALETLAGRSLADVTVDVSEDRYPDAVEGAAYFAVSEALANVAKYAQAEHVVVRGRWSDGALTMEVADDGVGGADAAKGTGLRGLADRLAAVDGTLEVTSPNGGGTRILARIPTPEPVAAG